MTKIYRINQLKKISEEPSEDKHYQFVQGITLLKSGDQVDFKSNQIIYGHDVSHPLIADLINSFGLFNINPTSVVDEALDLGLSLSKKPTKPP